MRSIQEWGTPCFNVCDNTHLNIANIHVASLGQTHMPSCYERCATLYMRDVGTLPTSRIYPLITIHTCHTHTQTRVLIVWRWWQESLWTAKLLR